MMYPLLHIGLWIAIVLVAVVSTNAKHIRKATENDKEETSMNEFQSQHLHQAQTDSISFQRLFNTDDTDILKKDASETTTKHVRTRNSHTNKRRKDKSKSKKRKDKQIANRIRHSSSCRRRNRKDRDFWHERRSCKTKFGYVVLKEAQDTNGDVVKIAPLFEVEGVEIDQIFHESYCDVEKCTCKGIDTDIYESSCETNYSYTYARVIKGDKVNWGHIKIRSGCSCLIKKKWQRPQTHILDL